ncbi:hypothetical protein GCM10010170_025670 [Dactylosporangium salmoneum]|uniref:Uncharacterized protein n=1 Tax=Dactylosporangium salmoneum TaxID=53361 RepID=A0ABN3G0Y8_9ACTN
MFRADPIRRVGEHAADRHTGLGGVVDDDAGAGRGDPLGVRRLLGPLDRGSRAARVEQPAQSEEVEQPPDRPAGGRHDDTAAYDREAALGGAQLGNRSA